jgi:multidrug efflux pump subunit AcrA (membrane-fusion protein)
MKMSKRLAMMNSRLNSVFILLLSLLLLYACSTSLEELKYRVKRGELIATLNETGELEAVDSRLITMPFIGYQYGWEFKIIGLVEHGTQVSMGDSIAKIDNNQVLKELAERQNQQEIEEATLRKINVQNQNTLQNLKIELMSAQSALKLSKIQLDKGQFESNKERKIDTLEYERDLVKLKKAERNYLFTQTVLKNEKRIQEIKVFQLENAVQDAQDALKKLVIRSPLDGMMQVLQNRRTRQFVKVGDELYQGQRFASVPDLSKMKVKSTVNEADIAKLHLKQKVVIRLDAFPSIPFEGEIIEISRLSRKENEKSRTKVFDIVILLYKSDPILKPGMTVRCEIFTAQLDDVYYVENECIIRENLRYYLFIEDDGDFTKKEIKIGPRNYQYTVIYGDYSVGQRVLPLQELDNKNLSKTGM